jgi:hypothetical protein
MELLLDDIKSSRPKNKQREKEHVIPLEHAKKRDKAALKRPNFKGMNKKRRTRQKSRKIK